MVGKNRLVIADDHTVFRSGLRRLLESTANLKVVGEAGKGNEVVTLVNDLRPHVLLLDVRLPELSGLEVARRIVPLEWWAERLGLTTEIWSATEALSVTERDNS